MIILDRRQQTRAHLSAWRPHPAAVRTYRGVLTGLLLAAGLWLPALLIAWSLA